MVITTKLPILCLCFGEFHSLSTQRLQLWWMQIPQSLMMSQVRKLTWNHISLLTMSQRVRMALTGCLMRVKFGHLTLSIFFVLLLIELKFCIFSQSIFASTPFFLNMMVPTSHRSRFKLGLLKRCIPSASSMALQRYGPTYGHPGILLPNGSFGQGQLLPIFSIFEQQ